MGMLESPAAMPDIAGLPEYRVTEMYTEIDGRDIRLAFGTRRFGHVEWLYSVVVSPEVLLKLCTKCEVIAAEAIYLASLMVERTIGH